MEDVVRAFVEAPSAEFLDGCTNNQLVKIAKHYEVDVGDKRVKETVKVNLKVGLFKMGVLGTAEAVSWSARTGGLAPPSGGGPGLSFEQQKELLLLQMKLEIEREVAVEKMRQETAGKAGVAEAEVIAGK